MRDQWGYIAPVRRRKRKPAATQSEQPTPEEQFDAVHGAGRYRAIEAGECTATDAEILLLASLLNIPQPTRRKRSEPNFERQFRHAGKGVNRHGIRRL